MTLARRIVIGLLFAALCLSGCSDHKTRNSEPLPSATSPQPPNPSVNSEVWLDSVNAGGGSPLPEFPKTLEGFRLGSAWNVMPRAFEGQKTSAPGPDYGGFPATMNGCDDQRFLIRWRAVNDSAEIMASWSGDVASGLSPSSAGWLALDGCETPQFELAGSADGSTLSDVSIDVQQWVPAP